MIQSVIFFLIKMGISFLNEQNKEKLRTQVEALKGRADSVEESFEEQEAARKAAEEAAHKAENSGTPDDVFGSEG